MKILWEGLPIDEVPDHTHKPGEFFTRLVGVNVSNVGNSGLRLVVEPLYIPLVRVQKRAGQILIEINSDRPLVYITLQVRRPFLNVFRFQWETLDSGLP